ncbi:MAG: adenylosuccinate lyase [Parcubacteria group bacterium Gr01-1014_20]|nr:MAG: adenylosuccinate lyase [Parcubacteria group bacterium Gr01-1014_20]
MLDRYTRPEMNHLWMRKDTKFQEWLNVELAYLKARLDSGQLSLEAFDAISRNAKIVVERIEALDKVFKHDMIAFIKAVHETLEAAGVGSYKEELHKFLTSYDVEDPALIMMLRRAIKLVIDEFERLESALRDAAKAHKWTLMIARTHGQYAEPTSFGCLLLVYANGINRSILRLRHLLDTELNEGKMSGAVGTYGGMDPELEEKALAVLGLVPAKAETQILQRDRHAMVIATLAVASGTISQMCRTFWEMMRSDVKELREPTTNTQRGSSSMPQKKNPIYTEQGMGLPRVVSACASAAFENISTPEHRDISQSSVEREIFPTATGLVHYLAHRMTWLVENLVVREKRMKKNLEVNSLGVWASQRVRNALMSSGLDYDTAYTYIQKAAFATDEDEENEVHLLVILSRMSISEDDPRTAASILGEEELEACFNAKSYIEGGVEHIFRVNGF